MEFAKAKEVVEEQREALSPGLRTHFFNGRVLGYRRTEAYEGLVRAIVESQDLLKAGEGFFWSENIKGRAFMDAMASSAGVAGAKLSQADREKERDLTAKIAFARRQKSDDPTKAEEIDKILVPLEKEFAEFKTGLAKQFPDYFALKYPEPLNAAQVDILDHEALLCYEVMEDETVAFVLKRNNGKVEVDHIFVCPVMRRDLEDKIRKYIGVFDHVSDFETADAAAKQTADLGQELYKLLLAGPLSAVGRDRLMVVPDEALWLLPLESLPIPPPNGTPDAKARPHYVGDDRAITYWQSASTLTLARKRPHFRANRRVALILAPGRPRIPGAGAGIHGSTTAGQLDVSGLRKDLDTLLMGRLDVCDGESAREGHVRSSGQVAAASAVIFTTHGASEEARTGQPVLVLAAEPPGSPDDGLLTMSEVLNMHLNAEVVALMACQTGSGAVVAGEGVMGLGRAFQHAGAQSVLASLWRVEDVSAGLLTGYFIENLTKGDGLAEALKHARTRLREERNGAYASPYYWSPFIMIGGGSPDPTTLSTLPPKRTVTSKSSGKKASSKRTKNKKKAQRRRK